MGLDAPKGQNPVNAPRCGDFGHRKKGGELCRQFVVRGTEHCASHAGKPLSVHRARGEIVMLVRNWGLGDTDVNTAQLMLRLISQSASRVGMLSSALGEAYDAADRLRAAHVAQRLIALEPEGRGDDGVAAAAEQAAEQAARQDLDRIFSMGGIAALVGYTYASTKDGDIFATGEAIRGLQILEGQERDRLFDWCAKAEKAEISRKQIALAQQHGAQMASVFNQILAELDLPPEKMALVPGAVTRVIGRAMTIEGQLA